jgi:hypothetical protein
MLGLQLLQDILDFFECLLIATPQLEAQHPIGPKAGFPPPAHERRNPYRLYWSLFVKPHPDLVCFSLDGLYQ